LVDIFDDSKKMYAVHKYVVFENQNSTIVMKDIKSGHEECYCGNVRYVNSDYIVIDYWSTWNIMGKHKLKVNGDMGCIIVGDKLIVQVYEYKDIDSDDFVLFLNYPNYVRSVIYDIVHSSREGYFLIDRFYFDVLLLPNNKILCYKDKYYEFESWDAFLNNSLNNRFIDIPSIIWVDSNNIISAIYGFECISVLRIYDLNYKIKHHINITRYHIPSYRPKLVVCDNIIYLWNNDIILIVNEGNINVIRNIFCVQVYSVFYGVFINMDMKLFRICNNKLVSCRLNYDFWRDSDQPAFPFGKPRLWRGEQARANLKICINLII